jgi:hypothetical protein
MISYPIQIESLLELKNTVSVNRLWSRYYFPYLLDSIYSCTYEQVFLELAKYQKENTVDDRAPLQHQSSSFPV